MAQTVIMRRASLMRRASISAAPCGGFLDLEPRLSARAASRRRALRASAHRPVAGFYSIIYVVGS
jgi:hypothetical protein